MSPSARVVIRYEIPRTRPDWTLPEEPVPESQPHDQTLDLLKAILLAWALRTNRDALVARNLAVRWDESAPSVGVDPDLCVIEPRPPDADGLESLCTWKPGHVAPRLAVEVVSSRPRKDYAAAPEKCAAAGVEELWVFDPALAGPKSAGGPHRIQIWRREEEGFHRVYAGEGPAWSPMLSAFVVAVHEGRRLRVTADANATDWWLTAEEAERMARESERTAKEAALAAKEEALAAKEAAVAEKEAALAERDAERAAKEAALARLLELEASSKR